jgi:hypothetical protein
MVVSTYGAFLGTKVDPSFRIVHLYEQTKWRIQLQAMLSRKANGNCWLIGSDDGDSNPL